MGDAPKKNVRVMTDAPGITAKMCFENDAGTATITQCTWANVRS